MLFGHGHPTRMAECRKFSAQSRGFFSGFYEIFVWKAGRWVQQTLNTHSPLKKAKDLPRWLVGRLVLISMRLREGEGETIGSFAAWNRWRQDPYGQDASIVLSGWWKQFVGEKNRHHFKGLNNEGWYAGVAWSKYCFTLATHCGFKTTLHQFLSEATNSVFKIKVNIEWVFIDADRQDFLIIQNSKSLLL